MISRIMQELIVIKCSIDVHWKGILKNAINIVLGGQSPQNTYVHASREHSQNDGTISVCRGPVLTDFILVLIRRISW